MMDFYDICLIYEFCRSSFKLNLIAKITDIENTLHLLTLQILQLNNDIFGCSILEHKITIFDVKNFRND